MSTLSTRVALIWRLAVSDGVPRSSLLMAVVVGTLLNAINQGDRLASGQALDFLKITMTYAVPYLVSTYGAVGAKLRMLQQSGLIRGAKELNDGPDAPNED